MLFSSETRIAIGIKALPADILNEERKVSNSQIHLSGFKAGMQLPQFDLYRPQPNTGSFPRQKTHERRDKQNDANVAEEEAEGSIAGLRAEESWMKMECLRRFKDRLR